MFDHFQIISLSEPTQFNLLTNNFYQMNSKPCSSDDMFGHIQNENPLFVKYNHKLLYSKSLAFTYVSFITNGYIVH